MKRKCVACNRDFEFTGDFKSYPNEMFMLGSDCFRRAAIGDLNSKIMLWNAKDVARQTLLNTMNSSLEGVLNPSMDEETKSAISMKASMIAWYSSQIAVAPLNTRIWGLDSLHESISHNLDSIFPGIQSLKKMNDDLYQHFLEKAKNIYDPENAEAYRNFIGQITGVILPREKSPEDYLWSELTRENAMAYPYALAGISPQSPTELLMSNEYFNSLQRSFVQGCVGVSPDIVDKYSVFDPFTNEDGIRNQANLLSDKGLGANDQRFHLKLMERALLANAFLKTGKDDTFEANISAIMENIDTSEDDRDILHSAIDGYRKRVAAEKYLYADLMAPKEELRPRSLNEYATITKSLKDIIITQGQVSAADPAVIAMAPLLREIEESGRGTGLVLSFGSGQVGVYVSKNKEHSDPFQRACDIFKERTATNTSEGYEDAVDEQTFVILVNGEASTERNNETSKSKRTIAFVFEKNIVSPDMAAMRTINTSKLAEQNGDKLGLVITESWEMPHDRTKNIYAANLRPIYDRSIKNGSPMEEKETRFFQSRFGRIGDTMSAFSFDVNGTWLKHMPGPNTEEREILRQKLDPENTLASAFGQTVSKTFEALGIDPLERFKKPASK